MMPQPMKDALLAVVIAVLVTLIALIAVRPLLMPGYLLAKNFVAISDPLRAGATIPGAVLVASIGFWFALTLALLAPRWRSR